MAQAAAFAFDRGKLGNVGGLQFEVVARLPVEGTYGQSLKTRDATEKVLREAELLYDAVHGKLLQGERNFLRTFEKSCDQAGVVGGEFEESIVLDTLDEIFHHLLLLAVAIEQDV
jgi:hypothetical protein